MIKSSGNIALQMEGLSVGYIGSGRKTVLFQDLEISLMMGELICFMGPNGIGKSSLIRTLAGLQKPLAGEIRFQTGDTKERAKLLSVVLTDRVTAAMTAYELICFGRYPHLDWTIKLSHDDKSIIEMAIEQTRITEFLGKKIHELSDGQMQMVMIARALAQATDIIVLDEPTAHLDLNNRVEIMKLLKDLTRKMNKAILIATHELDLALQMADKIWLSGKSRNLIIGLPEDLVLDGSFDDIFQFKGFDLKSGRIRHEITRSTQVILKGSDHYFLWTKNALERNGFHVISDPDQNIESDSIVTIMVNDSKVNWTVQQNDRLYTVFTIADLLKHL
jgi:iron complex transport system ATP-binding protein